MSLISALALQTDQEIVQELIQGDRERAANAFVRRHQRFVFATAQRYLMNYDDAEDAAQEVFIRALKNLHTFRGDSSVQTWLYRITMNVCTSMRRRKKLLSFFSGQDDDAEPEIPSEDYTPYQIAENQDFEQRFQQMLQQLPPKQRETFVLRYVEELSYEEISVMLGTSVGGLKANYFQAVQKLARILRPDETMKGEQYE
jgi:RNA polymerase sigma-70 factor (ECF subfamily)